MSNSIRPEQIEMAGAVQRQAASDESRWVRLVAGPGTGKSFSIEERVIWLLGERVAPSTIFGASFTRLAAGDLQARVQAACRRAGYTDNIRVSTLHALALRSLKAGGQLPGYGVDPVVLDSWELKELFDPEFACVAGVKPGRAREIREYHEAFWSTGRYDVPPFRKPPEPPIDESERRRFVGFLRPHTSLYGCVLPGELVQMCVQSMRAGTLDPVELLDIRHLIVDEFQDLNPMDLAFVYRLESLGASLFVAGDDDQSLYQFRYAHPAGIQRFTERFPGVGDHVLKHCFRCTPEVLGAAETLIHSFPAPGRIEKDHVSLYADSAPPIEGEFLAWKFRDADDEARAIATSCQRLIAAGLPPQEIMVLISNTNALRAPLTRAFEELEVPFEPPRDKQFRDTDTGRALFTITRLVEDEPVYPALRTLLRLRKGVGIRTIARIAEEAIEHGMNYHDVFFEPLPEGVFSPRSARALQGPREVCAQLLPWSAEDTIEDRAQDIDAVLAMILGSDPEESWKDEIEALPDRATLKELGAFLGAVRDSDKAAVIEAVCKRLGREVEENEALPERVRMLTMHGAKGLSATVVFIPALEEEVLPGPRRARHTSQVLEAARMLYVSITRARLVCVASFATRRFMAGRSSPHSASRFATHLGKEFKRLNEVGITTEHAEELVATSRQL